MKRLVVASLLALLVSVGSLPGCGGGSGTEDALRGKWWGPALQGGSRAIEFEGGGRVVMYYKDGNPTGDHGWIKHREGAHYDVYFESNVQGTFMLGPTGNQAALLKPGDDFVALQRGATNWATGGFDLADLVPGDYAGITWFSTNAGFVLGSTESEVTFSADDTYAGEDREDRIFGSPAGTTISLVDPVQGVFFGEYSDQFRPTGGEITVMMTPDKELLVTAVGWDPFGWYDGWFAIWSRR